jgi:deoxyribonuclease-4
MIIGAHISYRGGLEATLARARALGAEAIQVFTSTPRSWQRHGEAEGLAGPQVTSPEIPVFCHASYLINLASPDPELRGRSQHALLQEIRSADRIRARGVVLHLGSHVGTGRNGGIERAASAIGEVLSRFSTDVKVLLENSAGGGSSIGADLGELATVREMAGADPRIGFCLDTQHLWATGIAFRTIDEADQLVEEVARVLGLSRLHCLHLNDSKVALGARADRHQNLGQGMIGRAALGALISHPALQGIPAILEVPGARGQGPERKDIAEAKEIWHEGTQARAQLAGDCFEKSRRRTGSS